MNLSDIHRGVAKRRGRKRIGRGTGSGLGKTAGRGHKGQGSRSGVSQKPTFQGGTMPLVRRIPKRGFNNRWALKVVVVNVGELEEAFDAGTDITADALVAKNLARGRFDVIKVLGDGELTKKLNVSAHRFSRSAIEKIERAGGKVIVIPGKTPVAVKQRQAAARS